MSYLDRIHACNNLNLDDFIPFFAGDKQIGHVYPKFMETLSQWNNVFITSDARLELHPQLQTFAQRSDAVEQVNNELMDKGIITRRLVNEAYGVTLNSRDNALFTVDRAAAAHYGIRAFGQHLNGFVNTPSGMKMWVGIRALDKPNEPGKMDQIVAGGLPHTLSLDENLKKECAEEADIPASLAAQAVLCGEISYRTQTKEGAKPDTMFCYDLELPQDFSPRCTDGEVDGFELLPIEEIAQIVKTSTRFKLNCNLVIIDFLIRHGYLDSREADFATIQASLRQ